MQFSSTVEEMAYLFSKGYSLGAIGERLGVSRETVRRAILALGIDTNYHHRISFEARRYGRMAIELRDQGRPWRAISESLGYSERTLRRYFIEASS